jgi:FlaA1/EpsC-like NDP-sugar epimerase
MKLPQPLPILPTIPRSSSFPKGFPMQNGIQDKVVIVTGASSGLGEATARHLAQRGAKVVLGARRAERLQQIVAEIQAQGGQATALAGDVSVPPTCRPWWTTRWPPTGGWT